MEEVEFRAQTLVERLREMAFLNKSLEIVFRDERPDEPVEQIFKYDGGIVDFVTHLNASKEPLFEQVVAIGDTYDAGEVEIAMQWNNGYYEGIHSFANNIATTEGGMHEEGFKKSLTNVLNRYARQKGHLKEKDENLHGEDIREGLTAIVSVKLRNPQFEGQTKTKLGNTEIRSFVEKVTNDKLAEWLEEHPTEGRTIVAEGVAGGAGADGRARRRATSRGASRCSSPRRCRASSPTARRATPKKPSCSSSRATAPAAARRRRATPRSRRSCRSAARS